MNAWGLSWAWAWGMSWGREPDDPGAPPVRREVIRLNSPLSTSVTLLSRVGG